MEMRITMFALVCAIIIVTRNTLLEYLDARNRYQNMKSNNNPGVKITSILHKMKISLHKKAM